MAIVKHAINENDFIELRGEVGKWPAGTTGTVVSDYGDVKLVEISDDRGVMADLIQVPEPRLKLISKHSH
jgi:hypothetical protein